MASGVAPNHNTTGRQDHTEPLAAHPCEGANVQDPHHPGFYQVSANDCNDGNGDNDGIFENDGIDGNNATLLCRQSISNRNVAATPAAIGCTCHGLFPPFHARGSRVAFTRSIRLPRSGSHPSPPAL
jgi:hypothetical protein